MSAIGTAVLLKFDSLQSLENYMSLYFQVQFLKLKCTERAKSTIKNALKSERKKKVSSLKKGLEKKCKSLKREIETQSQDDSIKRENIRKILNKKKNMKKRNIRKILSQKKNKEKINSGKPWTKKRI